MLARNIVAVLREFAVIKHADSLEKIRHILQDGNYSALFCPWRLGSNPWTEVLAVARRESGPALPVIVVARNGGWKEWAEVLDAGGSDLLVPPISKLTAMAALQQAGAVRSQSVS